jgi:hypothetical protein
MAGIIGPQVVNNWRDARIAAGIPRDQVYDPIMYALVGLLVLGLLCNFLVRPVARRRFMSEDEVIEVQHGKAPVSGGSFGIGRGGLTPMAVLAWLAVGIPIAWGVWITCEKALVLFG